MSVDDTFFCAGLICACILRPYVTLRQNLTIHFLLKLQLVQLVKSLLTVTLHLPLKVTTSTSNLFISWPISGQCFICGVLFRCLICYLWCTLTTFIKKASVCCVILWVNRFGAMGPEEDGMKSASIVSPQQQLWKSSDCREKEAAQRRGSWNLLSFWQRITSQKEYNTCSPGAYRLSGY